LYLCTLIIIQYGDEGNLYQVKGTLNEVQTEVSLKKSGSTGSLPTVVYVQEGMQMTT